MDLRTHNHLSFWRQNDTKKYTLDKRQHLLQMAVGEVNIPMSKEEARSMFVTLYKKIDFKWM